MKTEVPDWADESYQCMECCERPVTDEDEFMELCHECWIDREANRAEAAYERMQEGECFLGGEAEAYQAEEQARIQRELK